MTKCIDITKDNFEEEVLRTQDLVVLDFWTPWCGPCKMIEPVLDEIAEYYVGKGVKVCKINSVENNELVKHFGVRAAPTLMFLKNGENLQTKVGFLHKIQILAIIEKLLAV